MCSSFNITFYDVFYKKQTRSLCFITSLFPVNVHTLGLSVFLNTFPLRRVISALSFYCVTSALRALGSAVGVISLFLYGSDRFCVRAVRTRGIRRISDFFVRPRSGGKALLFVHTIRKRISCHLGTVVYRISDRTSTPNWLWI